MPLAPLWPDAQRLERLGQQGGGEVSDFYVFHSKIFHLKVSTTDPSNTVCVCLFLFVCLFPSIGMSFGLNLCGVCRCS